MAECDKQIENGEGRVNIKNEDKEQTIVEDKSRNENETIVEESAEKNENKNKKAEWQLHKKLTQSSMYMLENKLDSDVILKVSNNNLKLAEKPYKSKKIEAHKHVLKARSPVFFEMFRTNNKEEGIPEVVIDDVDPDAFDKVLKYMYSDQIDISRDHIQVVLHILHVSKKFDIPDVANECMSLIKHKIDMSNACIVLDHSLFLDMKDLAMLCRVKIVRDTSKAINSVTFMKIQRSTLENILEWQIFSTREIEIFKACEKWAKHVCQGLSMEDTGENKRKILGPVLNKIHFPVMSITEFSGVVSPSGILNQKEELFLYRYIGQNQPEAGRTLKQFPFNNRCLPGHFDGPFVATADGHDYESVNIDNDLKRQVFQMEISTSVDIHMQRIYIADVTKLTKAVKISSMKVNGLDVSFVDDGQKHAITVDWIINRGITKFQVHINFDIKPYTVGEFIQNMFFGNRKENKASMLKDTAIKCSNDLIDVEMKCVRGNLMPICGFQFELAPTCPSSSTPV